MMLWQPIKSPEDVGSNNLRLHQHLGGHGHEAMRNSCLSAGNSHLLPFFRVLSKSTGTIFSPLVTCSLHDPIPLNKVKCFTHL
jgi:hypothetical protein